MWTVPRPRRGSNQHLPNKSQSHACHYSRRPNSTSAVCILIVSGNRTPRRCPYSNAQLASSKRHARNAVPPMGRISTLCLGNAGFSGGCLGFLAGSVPLESTGSRFRRGLPRWRVFSPNWDDFRMMEMICEKESAKKGCWKNGQMGQMGPPIYPENLSLQFLPGTFYQGPLLIRPNCWSSPVKPAIQISVTFFCNPSKNRHPVRGNVPGKNVSHCPPFPRGGSWSGILHSSRGV